MNGMMRATLALVLMAGVLAYAAKHNIEIPFYIKKIGELANNPRL